MLEPNTCQNCADPVRITKPSKTGLHYCAKPECRAARQRALHRDRAANAATGEKHLVVLLVRTLAQTPRVRCSLCGLVDALPEYAHPDPTGLPCRAVGATRMGSLAPELIDAIWPVAKRTYAEDPDTLVLPG